MDNNAIRTGDMNTESATENSHTVILEKLDEINNRLKKIEEQLLTPLISNEDDKMDAIGS